MRTNNYFGQVRAAKAEALAQHPKNRWMPMDACFARYSAIRSLRYSCSQAFALQDTSDGGRKRDADTIQRLLLIVLMLALAPSPLRRNCQIQSGGQTVTAALGAHFETIFSASG